MDSNLPVYAREFMKNLPWRTRLYCKVMFVLPDQVEAESVTLHGDFTKWEKKRG